jgi:hypothetical protein
MESQRKSWNKQQTEFRKILLSFSQHQEAMQMFLSQHAMLHSMEMAQTESWSYEDEIFENLTEEGMRRIPKNCEHSVAWNLWHIARIEDVTMNLLVAGELQIFHRGNWQERMKVSVRHSGNAMDMGGVADLSARMDIQALRAYRMTVGRKTREVVKGLQPEELKQAVQPSRIQQVADQGAVLPAAQGIIDYWSKRNIAGLLLMPPTRHCFVHLNEAAKLKRRRQ